MNKWSELRNTGLKTLRSISKSRNNISKYGSNQKSKLGNNIFQIEKLNKLANTLRLNNKDITFRDSVIASPREHKIDKAIELVHIKTANLTPEQRLNIKAQQLKQVAKHLKEVLKDIKNDLLNVVQSFQCLVENNQIENLKAKINNQFDHIAANFQQEPNFLDQSLNEHSTIQRLSRKQKMTQSMILSQQKNNQFFLPIGHNQNKLAVNSDRSFNQSFLSEHDEKNMVIKVIAPPTRDKQQSTKRSTSTYEKSRLSGTIQTMKSILQLQNINETQLKKTKHERAAQMNPKFVK